MTRNSFDAARSGLNILRAQAAALQNAKSTLQKKNGDLSTQNSFLSIKQTELEGSVNSS